MVQIPEPETLIFSWKTTPYAELEGVLLTGPDGNEGLALGRLDQHGVLRASRQGTLKGLAPGAKSSYRIVHSGFLGRKIEVAGPFPVTAPVPKGQPFRFLVFGDSGTGNNAQCALAELMIEQRPDLVIHAGDLVYPTGAPEDYSDNFFRAYAGLVCSVPFMPSLGNHDCVTDKGRPLLDLFDLPRNGPEGIEAERNYWFDFGDARFVALDSNRTAKEAGGVITVKQMKTVIAPWLRSVLCGCGARWRFVYFHHPFYTGSTHPAQGGAYMKEAYVEVFEDCGVDVVFCGHNHLYERTAPIKEDRIVADGGGAVYVTTGAGGARRYPENLPPPEYIRAYNDEALSFTRVDILADRLELRQIDDQGRMIDEYEIVKPPTEQKAEQ
jgi:predicted phosphodiesterase